MTHEERNQFVESIIPWALVFCKRRSPGFCRAMGDELSPELWIWFLQRAEQYDPAKGKPSTWASFWVRSFIFRKCRARMSGNNRLKIASVPHEAFKSLPAAERTTPGDCLLSSRLESAVNLLPPGQRFVIRRKLEGATLTDIAKEEGCNRSAVEDRFKQAVRGLRLRFGVHNRARAGA